MYYQGRRSGSKSGLAHVALAHTSPSRTLCPTAHLVTFILGGSGGMPPGKYRVSEMPFPALQKAIYRVLKVTKCRKISQIVLSTRVTEIISIDFVVYY